MKKQLRALAYSHILGNCHPEVFRNDIDTFRITITNTQTLTGYIVADLTNNTSIKTKFTEETEIAEYLTEVLMMINSKLQITHFVDYITISMMGQQITINYKFSIDTQSTTMLLSMLKQNFYEPTDNITILSVEYFHSNTILDIELQTKNPDWYTQRLQSIDGSFSYRMSMYEIPTTFDTTVQKYLSTSLKKITVYDSDITLQPYAIKINTTTPDKNFLEVKTSIPFWKLEPQARSESELK